MLRLLTRPPCRWPLSGAAQHKPVVYVRRWQQRFVATQSALEIDEEDEGGYARWAIEQAPVVDVPKKGGRKPKAESLEEQKVDVPVDAPTAKPKKKRNVTTVQFTFDEALHNPSTQPPQAIREEEEATVLSYPDGPPTEPPLEQPKKRGRKRKETTVQLTLDEALKANDAAPPPLTTEQAAAAESGDVDVTPVTKPKRKRKEQTIQVKTDDLAQGLVEGEVERDEESVYGDGKGWPTVLQQVQNNMRKFSHCVVLTRVGNFYELYFEQATEYGSLLGIKIASKRANNTRVPMAGFPFYQLDRYLKILVQDYGKSVAISEEILLEEHERIKFGGLKNDRQVNRVVTPGTLIDENFLSPFEHNYLLALDFPNIMTDGSLEELNEDQIGPLSVGLAWLDLSSGDFITQTTTLDALSSSMTRIGPKEVLLQSGLPVPVLQRILPIAQAGDAVISYHAPGDLEAASETWSAMIQYNTAEAQYGEEETSSAVLLLDYVSSRLPGLQLRLQAPIHLQPENFMNIDRNSLRGLEVLRTMRDGLHKGSLLHAVRRTLTESGSRLLAQRLLSPSTSAEEINDRLDLVEALMHDNTLLEHLAVLLKRTSDTFRLVQKFSLGRGDADDLLRLAETIKVNDQIARLLSGNDTTRNGSTKNIAEKFRLDEPATVADRIANAIDEEGLTRQHEAEEEEQAEAAGRAVSVLETISQEDTALVKLQKRVSSKSIKKANTNGDGDLGQDDIWIMKRTASKRLSDLHDKLDNLRQEKIDLSHSLREKLGAETLSLKFTPGLGHICHIKGKDTRIDISAISSLARTVSSSKSTRSFYHPDWSSLGHRIEAAKTIIRNEEQRTFKSLRDLVITHLLPLRHNASLLDALDVATSSARLAIEHSLTRPILTHTTDTKIFAGRHIMVDAGLAEAGRQFTPNDCLLHGQEKIWLITGPNMAGKSTFLRQTALISILAQTGMFVPAAYAEIGLVDQIFSRVGSADDLSRDQSTFMVEMLETAAILRNATDRSFVIMDEVGRGTTPEDGLAVGYAVLRHLRQVNRCRSLFATHFHGLADMTGEWEQVSCHCTDVKETEDGGFVFDHQLREGVNRESHALRVAGLAGMPESVVESAREVLDGLNKEREVQELV